MMGKVNHANFDGWGGGERKNIRKRKQIAKALSEKRVDMS